MALRKVVKIIYFIGRYPSGDGAVLIKQLPRVRFPPLVFIGKVEFDSIRKSGVDKKNIA